MSENEIPFSSENIHQDVLSMKGKNDIERNSVANKAGHKLAKDFQNCTPEEFRDLFNDLALKSRIDDDKSRQVFCKTADGKIHDSLKPNEKDITEIWIGDPRALFNWGNLNVFDKNRELERQKHNQGSLGRNAGMLKTMLEDNKIE